METGIKDTLDVFLKDMSEYIEKMLSDKIDINKIKQSDGRKKDSLRCCKVGSYIYLIYNCDEKLIYIGETGETVKRRLFTDGSGAHCKKDWFIEARYIRYFESSNMDDKTRKLIERVLILKYYEECKLFNKD